MLSCMSTTQTKTITQNVPMSFWKIGDRVTVLKTVIDGGNVYLWCEDAQGRKNWVPGYAV